MNSIIVLLNVGRYIGKRGKEEIPREYYDENSARFISCHHSFFVYFIDANENCDFLGWEKPPELEKNARDLIYLLFDIT